MSIRRVHNGMYMSWKCAASGVNVKPRCHAAEDGSGNERDRLVVRMTKRLTDQAVSQVAVILLWIPHSGKVESAEPPEQS
jgi:hypothetical protein